MTFDPEGHIEITARGLFQLARDDPRRLIDQYLIQGTPAVFPTYDAYDAFLRELSSRLDVHPRNLILRGSSKLGFSIAPKVDKLWYEAREDSDLDLAIVDTAYYERIDQEVIRWEERNRADRLKGRASQRFLARQEDRYFNCCRIKDLPAHLFPHHFDAMGDVVRMQNCGRRRELNAFIYRDWWALRSRFEFDLKELCKGVPDRFGPPPDQPLPLVKAPVPRAAALPASTGAPATPSSGAEPPSGPSAIRPEQSPGGRASPRRQRQAADGAGALTVHPGNQRPGRSGGFNFPRPSCMMHSRPDIERTDVSRYVEWLT